MKNTGLIIGCSLLGGLALISFFMSRTNSDNSDNIPKVRSATPQIAEYRKNILKDINDEKFGSDTQEGGSRRRKMRKNRKTKTKKHK